MIRYLVGLFAALLFSNAALAAFPAYNTQWLGPSGYEYPLRATPGEACANRGPGFTPIYVVNGGAVGGYSYWCRDGNGTDIGMTVRTTVATYCPATATASGGNCTCNAGYSEGTDPWEAERTACVPEPVCEVGKARTVNVTAGWARSSRPDAADLVEFYGKPAEHDYNDGVCVGNIAKIEDCWRSQEPAANGLYRLSCDWTMIMTGDSMASGDVNADALKPIPACPGFLGEIQGKPACVGTASAPLSTNPLPSNTPTPKPGNPTAGQKPTTGEGSGSTGAGRTPASGSGGNTGGPGSAAVRPGWVGPSDGEDSGQPCGGPGQPVCAVKVDETGVPGEGTAEGRFSQGTTDLGTVQTDALGAFDDHTDIQLPSWSWTFAFPSGCTALVLPAFDDFEIDVCQFQPMIHDLMSVLWVIAGIWGLIALFQRATGT